MYHRNFLFHQYPGSCFTSGKPFSVEVPRPGKYKVTITLKTETPLEKVSIHTGSGNLAFLGNIPAGIYRRVTVVNIGNTIPDGWNRVCQNRTLTVTVTAKADCLYSLSVSEISCPAIYIAGSANEYTADALYKTDQPETPAAYTEKCPHIKWEKMLTAYIDQKIAVSDYSHSGLTIESFRKEGHYAAINEYSRPGDFFFFQFDPSGQSAEYWLSGGNYRRQLARYVIECQERLVYPVLLTPVAWHRREKSDNCINQSGELYLDACREISSLTATPVIELHKLNITSYDSYLIAGLAAQEIARTCEKHPERGYRFLAKCLRANC